MTRNERSEASWVATGLTSDAREVAKVLDGLWETHFSAREITGLDAGTAEVIGSTLWVCARTLLAAVSDFEAEVGDVPHDSGSYKRESMRIVGEAERAYENTLSGIQAINDEGEREKLMRRFRSICKIDDELAISELKKLAANIG